VQIARLGSTQNPRLDVVNRGRRRIELDLTQSAGKVVAHRLIARADILLEGSRPGVAERLGFGPDRCLATNERLIFGRMTGWGQSGPLAQTAGHDINYIALAGALHAIGTKDAPIPPLNLIGDYGGGAMYLAFGVLCALLEARRSGKGQVVDAAMVDGAASLMSAFYTLFSRNMWTDERASNSLDGGVPWYAIYETADGQHVAVGALEDRFWDALLAGLGIAAKTMPPRSEYSSREPIRTKLAAAFKQRTRDEWAAVFEQTDACVSSVLSLAEAPAHNHHTSREAFITLDGNVQPAPAPRLSRTPAAAKPLLSATAQEVLADWDTI
jgi:alpha-methylacyl-CoA racemase